MCAGKETKSPTALNGMDNIRFLELIEINKLGYLEFRFGPIKTLKYLKLGLTLRKSERL